ncbi:hypothetical protein HDU80_007994 [Chytriomyces hyalinus]|nr:hypothetical protein HDU80_007994 [Chytriomyces hyalinus]
MVKLTRMHAEATVLKYTFQSVKFSSKVNCVISKGLLLIESSNLITCHKLHKVIQQLAAEQSLNMNLKTRLQIPKSLDSQIYALFQTLESNARDARNALLVAGLKEVQAIQGEPIAELLEGHLAALWHDRELRTETASSDDANEELAELYVSSYALRGVDVGNVKRESFARYLKDASASAELTAFYPITFEGLRKVNYII